MPMGVFGTTVPVLTLGSLSKRWIVPGWRLGWIVTNDPNGIFRKSGVSAPFISIVMVTVICLAHVDYCFL